MSEARRAPEWRRVWAVAWKDLIIERRAKAAFNAMAFFAGLVLLTFGFAFGPDAPAGDAGQGTLLHQLAPGLIWVTVLFAGAGQQWDGAAFFPQRSTGGGLLNNPSARLRLRKLPECPSWRWIEKDCYVLSRAGISCLMTA